MRLSLRNQVLLVFLAGSLIPMSIVVWLSIALLDHSIDASPMQELDQLSRSLEVTGRELYQDRLDHLHRQAAGHMSPSRLYSIRARDEWPADIRAFWDANLPEKFRLEGTAGQTMKLMHREPVGVFVYERPVSAIGLSRLATQISHSRSILDTSRRRDLRRGLIVTLLGISGAAWLASLVLLWYAARRVSEPIQRLSQAMAAVAAGDLQIRLTAGRGEVGEAICAFNFMTAQLREHRDRLVLVTQLASWQNLGRKMAHELKNSLTPIRLLAEEIYAQQPKADDFLGQAAEIVTAELHALDRRIQAFRELAEEPPVLRRVFSLVKLAQDRLRVLRAEHPGLTVDVRSDTEIALADTDPDLVRATLVNLLDNAAYAAGGTGKLLLRLETTGTQVSLELHDSGPGLPETVRRTLFEPTITFKPGGMGLGLSIARKSALLCGGELELIPSQLGGAAFRLTLPAAARSQSAPDPEWEMAS